MEILNDSEDNRYRSIPEGEIASEKLAVNLATLKELQDVRGALERKATFDDALSTLNENDKNLVTYVIWRDAQNRTLWSTYYLDKDSSSAGAIGGSAYFEQQLSNLLGDFYGWDQPRIRWLLWAMSEGVADEFKRALAGATIDKTAQKVAGVLDVRRPELTKPIVDAILDNVEKARADRVFDPQDYFDPQEFFADGSPGSPRIEDFKHFVELMETSFKDAGAEKIPAAA